MTRKTFLSLLGMTLLGMHVKGFAKEEKMMPSLFLGHGSPMNLVNDNSFTRMLHDLGRQLPRPEAILVISAHWQPAKPTVTSSVKNTLLYDFFGFPDPLYDITYDAPGAPELAARMAEVIPGLELKERPLDHGCWALLHHMYPAADIPVLQLGMGKKLSFAEHFLLGKKLSYLRSQGVLIIASGNVTHNLREASFTEMPPPKWAIDFDAYVSDAFDTGRVEKLINIEAVAEVWRMSHPSDDHYIPLLYFAGTIGANEAVETVFEGFQNGSISMKGWIAGNV